MPYRTSQKPMDITITLTNEELKEAVRDYAVKRNTPIPADFVGASFSTREQRIFSKE